MEGIIADTVTEHALYSVTVGHADEHEIFRRCVRADGARCGRGDMVLGIGRFRSTTRGDPVTVDTDGLVLAEAGAAIPIGPGGFTLVKPDATGRLVTVGNLDPDPVAGLVFQAATATGDMVPVLLMRADPLRTMQLGHADTNEVVNRFVTGAGKRCAASQQQVGVSLTASAKNGEMLRVQAQGIAMVLSGAAIVLAQGSAKVKSDATGRAVTHSGNDPVAGLALKAAAGANELTPVLLGAF